MQKLGNFLRRYKVEIAIILLCFCVLLPTLNSFPAVRVGDGAEYYAMGIAWKETLRPYMTPTSWNSYQQFVNSNRVVGLQTANDLAKYFPELAQNQTNDFNHFWFYSFCAGVIGRFFLFLGRNVNIHSCFLLVHMALLSMVFIFSYHYYKWKGLIAVLFLLAASPIVWYIDKVHTEFFTFSLTTVAVIAALYGDYHITSLFLSLASTQNPSFAIVSVICLIIFLYKKRLKEITNIQKVIILLSLLIMALHPLYYLYRYGVLTPQTFIGGANMGGSLKYFYVWLVDPDVGLIPNWPVSLLLIGIGFWFFLKSGNLDYRFLFFCITYVVISLFAQSSTTNINSGATPGIARYALWYLCLFFPSLLHLMSKIKWKPIPILLLTVICISSLLINYKSSRPSLPESYATPSFSSRVIQTYTPKLYNPPPEVFAERYGGVGEAVWLENPIAVIGPDCEKYLFINRQVIGEKDPKLLLPDECGFEYFDALGFFITTPQKRATPYYGFLTFEEKSTFTNGEIDYPGPIYLNNQMPTSELDRVLVDGWSDPENWGVWSIGSNAKIRIASPTGKLNEEIHLILILQPVLIEGHSSTFLTINVNGESKWSGELTQVSTIAISLSPQVSNQEEVEVEFIVENPISPLQLGVSKDSRLLGVGLIGFQFSR